MASGRKMVCHPQNVTYWQWWFDSLKQSFILLLTQKHICKIRFQAFAKTYDSSWTRHKEILSVWPATEVNPTLQFNNLVVCFFSLKKQREFSKSIPAFARILNLPQILMKMWVKVSFDSLSIKSPSTRFNRPDFQLKSEQRFRLTYKNWYSLISPWYIICGWNKRNLA